MLLGGRQGLMVARTAFGRRTLFLSHNLSAQARVEPHEWKLTVGLQLQRPPVIVPELNWMEKKMAELFRRVEVADSLYSDHEMRHFEDLRRTKRITSGINVAEKDLEEAAKQTAADFEEASLSELRNFQPADRVTKADLTNNRHSVDRSLDRTLYLMLNSQIDGVYHWLPPLEAHKEEDLSLRATAERLFARLFPRLLPSVTAKFLSNAPAGHYEYRYPREVADKLGKVGARFFFFKVYLDVGNEPIEKVIFGDRQLGPTLDSLNPASTDYGWLTYAEVKEVVPSRLWKIFQQTLYTDELINIKQLLTRQKSKFYRYSNRLRKLEAVGSN